ncbi:MAG TPA: hypothetical protein PKK99_11780 [Bacteroidia bacterium]|nr:hypothetical protein [Bacteroidia bacterium]
MVITKHTPLKKFIILFLLAGIYYPLQSQDFLGLQSSNYAGVTGAYSNPANIADSRYKVDIALVGFQMLLDNNYVGIKRSSLAHEGSYTNPKSLKFHAWDNTSNPSAPNYYKNNFIEIINAF